jgi:ELWxxDGT repeat protein
VTGGTVEVTSNFSTGGVAKWQDVNGKLYFANGNNLYVVNGTTANLLKNTYSGSGTAVPIENMTALGNFLYFTAGNGPNGNELWRSDGTAAGTIMVADIITGTGSSSNPSNLTAIDDTLYFGAAPSSLIGSELMKFENNAWTQIKDINVGPGSSNPRSFTKVGDLVYFVADDGISGEEIWVTDGTELGTRRALDRCSIIKVA